MFINALRAWHAGCLEIEFIERMNAAADDLDLKDGDAVTSIITASGIMVGK